MGRGPQALEGSTRALQLAGVDPSTLLSAAMGAFSLETYETPLLDLTKTYSGIELVPARPGYIPIHSTRTWIIFSRSGTQTSPPTTNIGNDAAHTNIQPSINTTPSNVNVNGAVPISLAQGVAQNQGPQILPNATVYFDLTAPATGTGGYSCMARYAIAIFWVATELF